MRKIGMILRVRKACPIFLAHTFWTVDVPLSLPLSKYYTLAHTSSVVRQINQKFYKKYNF